MLTKDELLRALNKFIYDEEGMVTFYSNFSNVLMKHIPEIKKAQRDKIGELLSHLYRDSLQHRKLIDNLIKEIKLDPRNEY